MLLLLLVSLISLLSFMSLISLTSLQYPVSTMSLLPLNHSCHYIQSVLPIQSPIFTIIIVTSVTGVSNFINIILDTSMFYFTSNILHSITSASNVNNVFNVIGIIHVTIITSIIIIIIMSSTLLLLLLLLLFKSVLSIISLCYYKFSYNLDPL